MIKHAWAWSGTPGIRICKACKLQTRNSPVTAYSDGDGVWYSKRPNCGDPIDKVEKVEARQPGKTVHGNQIYDAKIKNREGRYFTAGIGFENKGKGYIKVEMFALPLGQQWDGVVYLWPSTGKKEDKEP